MPHQRERSLKQHIEKALLYSPLVGILGQRQVGKSTLLKSIVHGQYVTFDDGPQMRRAEIRPKSFLSEFESLTGIDECQKVPQLFSALKLHVDDFKKPGQFILSGSVRFTSRKAISESLTGRIFNLELLPMTLFEIKGLHPLNYLSWFRTSLGHLNNELGKRQKKIASSHVGEYLLRGGLPGICFSRENAFRQGQMRSHLETLLQRDIQQILATTTSYDSLLRLLTYLAENQGLSFSLTEASIKSNISQVTVKKLLQAFEGLFLIRRLGGFGFKNSPRFYLEDQGMANYLSPLSGANKINRWIFSQALGNIHYELINQYQVGYFESKYSEEVPLVFKMGNEYLGFLHEDSEFPTKKGLKNVKSFFTSYPKAKLIYLGAYDKISSLDERTLLVPTDWIS